MDERNGDEIELTILMPCLNEAETIGICIDKAFHIWRGPVYAARCWSRTTVQPIIHAQYAAKKMFVSWPSSNAATARHFAAGITAARGRYVIMGDADDSYDFARLDDFVAKLRQGYDVVMGNRFRGGISPGAMPVLHRYLGNPLLSLIGRRFFEIKIGDFHCGLRGFNRARVVDLNCAPRAWNSRAR